MKTSCIAVAAALGLMITNGSYAFAEDAGLDAPEVTANSHYQVSGNWSQLKRGWNVLTLKVTDVAGQSIIGATVTVDYDMVEMPMSPPNKPVEDKGGGFYEKRVFLGMKGKWKFDITVNSNAVEDTLIKIQEVTK
ncbi:MAG: FixH family protein [Bdellovibrionota bacterium]